MTAPTLREELNKRVGLPVIEGGELVRYLDVRGQRKLREVFHQTHGVWISPQYGCPWCRYGEVH